MLTADHVFVNKKIDHHNLKRLLPEDKITYVKPGITPGDFRFDHRTRREIRDRMGIGDEPVIITAAMFRPGVKTDGLSWVIRACGALLNIGRTFMLVIIGDGQERRKLEELAGSQVPGKVYFVGEVPRQEIYRYYSAGDVFVFPGIGESLGMVYLEAQSCGLPVVAFDNAGVPEVVKKGTTGFLLPSYKMPAYIEAIDLLLQDLETRRKMSRAAAAYIRSEHDLNRNYAAVEKTLLRIVNFTGG
ncbi:MAG: glycosyltransferase family 4 protein [Deltaproteobacteria bacterium]|nr:glycosyltransferase family 4 protein [Deltaproteobacteria bacterium]